MNRFYQDADLTREGGARGEDYRTPFAIDRDRIIHSPLFRKLQAKTQVFLSGEYDFYRTRLTHSIEVAQIGRSIVQYLISSSPLLAEDFHPDADLVEACCLAHDLGHPPFGHAGERALHDLMRDRGGFEGNAQTLRLLTKNFYERGTGFKGMDPTLACLDGVMKYKRLYGESDQAPNHFIYDDQDVFRERIWLSDTSVPQGLEANEWKSLECQIMDWADDTAYCLNDLIDGKKAGFLTIERLEKWAEGNGEAIAHSEFAFNELLEVLRRDNPDPLFGRKVGNFIRAVHLEENPGNPLKTHRYAYRITVDPIIEAEASLYKKIAFDLIFRSPQLQQIEYKGTFILERLFSAIFDHYVDGSGQRHHGIAFLPARAGKLIEAAESESEKIRVVSDLLSGLSDTEALRMYKRLFDPDFASIADLTIG